MAVDAHADDRGREATTPSEIPARGWWEILKRTFSEASKDRILLVAAGVTFYGLLALVPSLAAFITLYGFIFDPAAVDRQVASLEGVLPGGAIEIIRAQASRITSQEQSTLGVALAISLGLSLWSSAAGVKGIIEALNIAYDEEEKRSFLVLSASAILMTLGAIVFMIVAIGALAVLPVVLDFIGIGGWTEALLRLGRWPLLAVLVMLGLAVLYRYGPSRRHAEWRWITWGSAVAAIGWLLFSVLFTWYVANFGSYNETYGSLGAVVGLLTWMWLSTVIVLLGAELNAEIEHQTRHDTTEGGDKPMGARGARVADTVAGARR